jgi:tRNA nucleotidyltransferase (CCA-adding enzyme)
VTLAQDLARRDLTINAMALACPNTPLQEGFQDWLPLSPPSISHPNTHLPTFPALIDPYGGQDDLQNTCLRHVSPAFSEDPVRVLRVARFAARFPQFHIHLDTWALMHHMVEQGETKALVYERVWQEMALALMEKSPSRFFEVLNRVQPLGPEWPEIIPPSILTQLDQAAHGSTALPVRVALLAQSWPEPSLFQTHAHSLRMPRSAIQLGTLWLREQHPLQQASTFKAADWAAFFDRCDAWRQKERFEQLQEVWSWSQPDLYASVQPVLDAAWQAASSVNPGAVVAGLTQQKTPSQGMMIAQAIRHARQQAIQRALSSSTFSAPILHS